MQFTIDEEERWELLDLGVKGTEAALGEDAPRSRAEGFSFPTECAADGVPRTITMTCTEGAWPMLSYAIEPPPAFTRGEIEDAMAPVVYGRVDNSLGELPLLVFDGVGGEFRVLLSGITRRDVLRCIVEMLGRMVRLDRAAFARHYGLCE